MFSTYILLSQKDYKYYFGHTNNIENRLKKHNSGQVKSTKSCIPFTLFYSKNFSTKAEAYRRELYFKSLAGRNWLYSEGILRKD